MTAFQDPDAMLAKIDRDIELAQERAALHNHASHVQLVADDVALAADAASQVDLDGGAFGVLCSFLPGRDR